MDRREMRRTAIQEERHVINRLLPVYKQYLRTNGGFHANRWIMAEWFHNYVAHKAQHISITRQQIHSLLPLLDAEIGDVERINPTNS